jgi:hypothetical protein
VLLKRLVAVAVHLKSPAFMSVVEGVVPVHFREQFAFAIFAKVNLAVTAFAIIPQSLGGTTAPAAFSAFGEFLADAFLVEDEVGDWHKF